MSDLDFFVDLMTTRTVLGLDHTSTVAEVAAVLGPGKISKTWRGRQDGGDTMRIDDGLAEFVWTRWPPLNTWYLAHYGAYPNRLDGKNKFPALNAHYGRFRRTELLFDELAAAIRARGFTLELDYEWTRNDADDHRQYYEPSSGMSLITWTHKRSRYFGTVEKMVTAYQTPAARRGHRFPRDHREQEFGEHAQDLAAAGNVPAWLDRNEPRDDDRREWWSLLLTAAGKGDSPVSHPGLLALVREAVDREVNPPGDDASLLVDLAWHFERYPDDPLPAEETRPMIDHGLRRWLAAPPADLAEATRLSRAHRLDADELRLSRRLRDQIHQVAQAIPEAGDPDLVEQLRAWAPLRPELLRYPLFARPRLNRHKQLSSRRPRARR
ncbi:hypothetical protein V5P93_006662 [Actinokineospora auranticolor]|uniref:Uncharacterized protein n=1 Tax=Actinokineospora auranticolor TaxID=155976 RepID=A0A2S6GWS3_9PSEU|nr:hypothetical protein [Actinokineospora auranticolor]PPK69695.1 hypothetical protein CLV40_103305 [Actinokineospora auranticolor]